MTSEYREVSICKYSLTPVYRRLYLRALEWEFEMAKCCDICGKGPTTGNIVSHSHKKTRRRWLPNLQRVRVLHEGQTTHLKVCTSCIKSGKVTKVA